MTSERNVEFSFREAVRPKGWPELHHNNFENTTLDAWGLFDKASKNQTENEGFPDFVAYDSKHNIVIVVEVKTDAKQHGNETSSILDTAVGGALHYAKHAWNTMLEKNKKINIISIGATQGQKCSGHLVTIHGFSSLQENEDNPLPKLLMKSRSSVIPDFSDMVAALYSWTNIPRTLSIRKTNTSDIAVMEVKALLKMKFYNEHNRGVNKVHWTAIRDSLSEENTSVLGVIIVAIVESKLPLAQEYQCEGNKHVTYVLVDGQHRLMAYRQATKPIQEKSTVAVEILRVNTVEEALKLYEVHYDALPALEEEKVPATANEWPLPIINAVIEKMQDRWLRSRGTNLVSNSGTKPPGIEATTAKKDMLSYLQDNREQYQDHSAEDIFTLIEKNNGLMNPAVSKKVFTTQKKKPYSDLIMKEAIKQNFWLSFTTVTEWFEGPNG